MLFVIDAGNTHITMGVYRDNNLLFTARVATDTTLTEDQIAVFISNLFALNKVDAAQIDGAIISSVVPELTLALKKGIEKIIGVTPYLVGPGVKTGLNIKIDDPGCLGADMVTTAVAAKAKYPLPALVIDLGTATKISALDESGAFLGCSISPGVRISLNALASGASQLSQISLVEPSHAIGTNTPDSMRSGIVYGTADMLDGLVDRMNAEMATPVKTIIATGGLSDICQYCRHQIIMEPDLILEGLKLIYQLNQKK